MVSVRGTDSERRRLKFFILFMVSGEVVGRRRGLRRERGAEQVRTRHQAGRQQMRVLGLGLRQPIEVWAWHSGAGVASSSPRFQDRALSLPVTLVPRPPHPGPGEVVTLCIHQYSHVR